MICAITLLGAKETDLWHFPSCPLIGEHRPKASICVHTTILQDAYCNLYLVLLLLWFTNNLCFFTRTIYYGSVPWPRSLSSVFLSLFLLLSSERRWICVALVVYSVSAVVCFKVQTWGVARGEQTSSSPLTLQKLSLCHSPFASDLGCWA